MATRIIPVKLGFVKSFLVIGKRTIIVDTGMGGSLKKIAQAMEDNGVKPTDVSLILLTHAHGDHTGGLLALKEYTGAPVAVHACEAEFLASGKGTPAVLHSTMLKLLSPLLASHKPISVKPDVLLNGKTDLNPWGMDGFVIPTPGHTEGSMTLVTADGDAIVGDMVGGCKKPIIPKIYYDLDLMKKSIIGLGALGIKTVYTSHGSSFSMKEVMAIVREP